MRVICIYTGINKYITIGKIYDAIPNRGDLNKGSYLIKNDIDDMNDYDVMLFKPLADQRDEIIDQILQR